MHGTGYGSVHQQQQPQQLHPQALAGMNAALAAQQQANGHLMKPPQSIGNGLEPSPGPPSALNPHSVGNSLHPQAQLAGHSSVSPPGTANNAANPAGMGGFLPFMLPYPYTAGYGLPTPEQQAGLAELLLQQQRLNAAAAQLIGMPPQMQQSTAPNGAMGMNNNQFAGAPGSVPPYSLLFPGLLGDLQNNARQQLYQHYQQQYGQFGTANQVPQQAMHQVHQQQQHQNKPVGGMYPDLDDLMKNENMPPQQQVPNGHYKSSASSNGYNDSRTHGSYNTHARSDSSNGASPISSHHYHSVSPQPPAYIPSRHHPDYINSNQQIGFNNNNGNTNNPAAHLFQKTHSNHTELEILS